MLIEIRNAGFINKGAELMLYTALEMMKTFNPEAQFVMAPTVKNGAAPYSKRAELGFMQKAWLWRYGLQWGRLAAFVPSKIREMYGVVLDQEIDVVLDVSGFAYSDQWGEASCRELARSCECWKRQGTKIILLPQAFGPFGSKKNRRWFKVVAELADLIFARDSVSYNYMMDVTGERNNIRIAPDFTNLLTGILPNDFDQEDKRFCIVPNFRMIDKTEKDHSEAYVPFMSDCVQYLLNNGAKPFILIHEGLDDLVLAKKIQSRVASQISIVQESNPMKIKGILGVCDGTIGSRFHGLVSALSQGVPSLATGWSHKYEMLFQDYGFRDGLVDIRSKQQDIRAKIDLLLNKNSSSQIHLSLLQKSEELKMRSREMWSEVFKVIMS